MSTNVVTIASALYSNSISHIPADMNSCSPRGGRNNFLFYEVFLRAYTIYTGFYNSLSFKMEPVGAFQGTILDCTYFHPRTCDLVIPQKSISDQPVTHSHPQYRAKHFINQTKCWRWGSQGMVGLNKPNQLLLSTKVPLLSSNSTLMYQNIILMYSINKKLQITKLLGKFMFHMFAFTMDPLSNGKHIKSLLSPIFIQLRFFFRKQNT